MKLLIAGLLAYAGYRVFKWWLLSGPGPRPLGRTGREIDDVMVKDPFCEVYFPKRQGFEAEVNGQTVYFCSAECRDRYLSGTQDVR
ncbi:hypothetical protein ACFL0Q_07480 [Thermodesulfobacteriota bacterium]